MITPEQVWMAAVKSGVELSSTPPTSAGWQKLSQEEQAKWNLMAMHINNHFTMVNSFRKIGV